MKTVLFVNATRRKLIKALWSLSEHYYLFTDGSQDSISEEVALLASLEFWSKDQLIDLTAFTLWDVYDHASECTSGIDKLIFIIQALASLGLSVPGYTEMHSSQAQKVFESSLRAHVATLRGNKVAYSEFLFPSKSGE